MIKFALVLILFFVLVGAGYTFCINKRPLMKVDGRPFIPVLWGNQHNFDRDQPIVMKPSNPLPEGFRMCATGRHLAEKRIRALAAGIDVEHSDDWRAGP
jgi:hypothetical protein